MNRFIVDIFIHRYTGSVFQISFAVLKSARAHLLLQHRAGCWRASGHADDGKKGWSLSDEMKQKSLSEPGSVFLYSLLFICAVSPPSFRFQSPPLSRSPSPTSLLLPKRKGSLSLSHSLHASRRRVQLPFQMFQRDAACGHPLPFPLSPSLSLSLCSFWRSVTFCTIFSPLRRCGRIREEDRRGGRTPVNRIYFLFTETHMQ